MTSHHSEPVPMPDLAWLTHAIHVYMTNYPFPEGVEVRRNLPEWAMRYWNNEDSERLAQHLLGNWTMVAEARQRAP